MNHPANFCIAADQNSLVAMLPEYIELKKSSFSGNLGHAF